MENILPEAERERPNDSTLHLILVLFLLSNLIYFIVYVVPNFYPYSFDYHLTSLNSYLVVVLRIILPILSIAWSLQKKKQGWLVLIFLTSFNSFHYLLWILRLLLLGGSLLAILPQVLTLIFVISLVIFYLLLKKAILPLTVTHQSQVAAFLAGLILAFLFNLKIYFVG